MITQVERIKNYGIFKDFKWKKELQNFKQYNLLYGWNYSGKTTLSRIFRSIELEKLHQDFADAEFILTDDKGNKITQDKLSSTQYQFRVFNVDFIRDNLYWDAQEANPLFVLGEKDIRLEKQLKELKFDIQQLRKKRMEIERSKEVLEKNIKQALSDKSRELDRIRPPYDSRKLKPVLNEIENNPQDYYLEESDVKKLLKILKTQKKEQVYLNRLKLVDEKLINDIKNSLDKTILSRAIEWLKNDPELNNWIRKGVDIHRGKRKCEFCGNPLPENLLEEYEKHFSQEYEDFLDFLKLLKKRTIDHKKSIELTKLPDEKRLYPQLESEYKFMRQELENSINKYVQALEALISLLDEKINNPFKKISNELPDIQTLNNDIAKKIGKTGDVFNKHNDISDNYEKEQEKAFKKLQLHYASEFNKNYMYFEKQKELEELSNKIQNINNEIKQKNKEVEQNELQLSDISKAANKINDYLGNIFGKEHLKIKPTEKGKFQILRDGKKAKNLSEGEKTAIAFSYFLTRTEDKETDISNTIILIDDPISSLDFTHLYNTYALIRSKLSSCKQLFITTHNLEFFNLIKDWLKNLKNHNEKCKFYLIERISKDGKETSEIRTMPKTLLKFKSEYHFLFSKIKSFADNPKFSENLYQLPNIIRRFLEAFVGFKYASGLFYGLKFLIENEAERIKVNKFINNLSHQSGLHRNLFFGDIISECKSVVEIVLDAVKSKDPEHYQSLLQIYKDAKSSE